MGQDKVEAGRLRETQNARTASVKILMALVTNILISLSRYQSLLATNAKSTRAQYLQVAIKRAARKLNRKLQCGSRPHRKKTKPKLWALSSRTAAKKELRAFSEFINGVGNTLLEYPPTILVIFAP